MKFLFVTGLLVAFLAGCANTSIQVHQSSSVKPEIGTEPQVGKTHTASVGSVMFSQYKLWRVSSFRLSENYAGSIGGARVEITSNDNLVQATANSQDAYCTEFNTMRNIFGVAIKRTCFGGITPDGKVSSVMVPADAIWWSQNLPKPILVVRHEEAAPRSGSYRNELVFLGAAGKVIRLLYREYMDDLVRPAYSQEVSYDVSNLPMEISFRTAKFQVLELGGSTITYKVLSPLS